MSVYAPVFASTQSDFFSRQQLRESKRRKLHTDADDSNDSDTKEDVRRLAGASTTHHPVNRTDPYHVAGWPREADLPPHPFPHAPPAKERSAVLDLDAELANLNPPLYPVKSSAEDRTPHLKRSHASNLTALMHSLMLKGDWNRASRAWGLLLRTEIGGKGPAIRHHGSWSVAAELLMRRDEHGQQSETTPQDYGFQLVRKYYERLVLQYPKTARSKAKVTALSIYPVMFNVWIYEVQQRSKQDQETAKSDRQSSPTADISMQGALGDDHARRLFEIKTREASAAAAIIRRMDELMSGPPYDDHDVRERIAQLSPHEDRINDADVSLLDVERDKARGILRKAQHALGRTGGSIITLPSSIQQMLDDWDESEIT